MKLFWCMAALAAGFSGRAAAGGESRTAVSVPLRAPARAGGERVFPVPPEASPSPDEDFSVAWIQRLPVQEWVENSPHPETDGWPAEGAPVTWRVRIKNWWPATQKGVGWRCWLDDAILAEGAADLAPGYTDVDVPWTWTFTRHTLRFELDPEHAVAEFSEQNNVLTTWTDALTVAFWVEQSVYDYFHRYQKDLGIGANGWEDWAQRQVARWNALFAAARYPVDTPDGVLDRIRLDKITLVPDGALPLHGGLPTNNPDNHDRTTDLVWGFPATLLDGGMYKNHTAAVPENAFFYEGSLLHELGHARYLVDVYGFNVMDRADAPRVRVTLNGRPVAGTPHLPRTWQWWDHVFYFAGWDRNSPFQGLMNSDYRKIDRYSAAALNRIAGHRATRGNCNAPGNIGEFLNDLPARNTLQLVDAGGAPIPRAKVLLYRAARAAGDWYGKRFDDEVDAAFVSDDHGLVEVGRNPFTAGGPIRHGYGLSTTVLLLRVETGDRTGFAFLPSAWFNLEYWRGHPDHGYYEVRVPLLGAEREIADVISWPDGNGRRFRVLISGDPPPRWVKVNGAAAEFHQGAWWARSKAVGAAFARVLVRWPDGTTRLKQAPLNPPLPAPTLHPVRAEPGLRIQWRSRAGCLYTVEQSDDLRHWRPCASTAPLFGTGRPLAVTMDFPPHSPARFFRLRISRVNE